MNFPNDYINKIICGDCLEVMKGMPDKKATLCDALFAELRVMAD